MTVLHVYLIPKLSRGPYFGEGTMYVTGLYLKEYLDQACAGVAGFTGSDFHWSASASQIGETDLVCYVLSGAARSIVQKRGVGGDLGGGGSTAWSSRDNAMISEVYWESVEGDASTARLLANLIFHELLHNKLDAHPNHSLVPDVHKILGGTLSKTPVNSSMRPSKADIAKMKLGVPKKIPQYTGDL